MSHIDWQAYEDGSLSHEEMERANNALAIDPKARTDLEGLRSLKAAVSKTAELETVPIGKLTRALKKAARTRPRWILPAAAFAVFAVAYAGYTAWTNANMIQFDVTPQSARLCIVDPVKAAEWANAKNNVMVSPIMPAAGYGLSDVIVGADWTKFIYTKGPTTCFLFVRKGESVLRGTPAKHIGGNPVYLVHTRFGDGLCWNSGDHAYLLTGPNQEELWRLSSHFVRRGIKPYYRN